MGGAGRGRRLGFPTANLDVGPEIVLPAGVYGGVATLAYAERQQYPALVNIGNRPTFEVAGERTVEAYLLDFDEDVYGELVQLEFAARLRDELKFDSVEALVKQIDLDVVQTEQILGEWRF